MISANELRIQNLFENKGVIIKISVRIMYALLNDIVEGSGDSLQLLLPIPLTPEVLEKCGFEKEGEEVFWIYYKCPKWDMAATKASWHKKENYLRLDYIYLQLKHLHQLQNLYFDLTGSELEINL